MEWQSSQSMRVSLRIHLQWRGRLRIFRYLYPREDFPTVSHEDRKTLRRHATKSYSKFLVRLLPKVFTKGVQ